MTERSTARSSDYPTIERTFLVWIRMGLALVGLAFFVPTLPSPALAQSLEYPSVQSRIILPIDDSHLIEVKGHIHPLARAEFDRGLVDDGMPVEHLIVLLQRTPEQQQAADKQGRANQ